MLKQANNSCRLIQGPKELAWVHCRIFLQSTCTIILNFSSLCTMVKILPFLQHFFLYKKFPWSKNYYLEKVLFVARFKNFLEYTYYIKQKNTFLNLDMNLRIREMHSFYWILRRFWSYGSMQFCQHECYRILNYLLWKTAVNHMAIGLDGSQQTIKVVLMPVFS